jgi:hypothetical protein
MRKLLNDLKYKYYWRDDVQDLLHEAIVQLYSGDILKPGCMDDDCNFHNRSDRNLTKVRFTFLLREEIQKREDYHQYLFEKGMDKIPNNTKHRKVQISDETYTSPFNKRQPETNREENVKKLLRKIEDRKNGEY